MRQDLKIKDQLVTGEDFMVSEHMDGVLVTKPVLSEKDLFKYYDSSKYVSHNKGRGFFNRLFDFFSKWMLRKKFNFELRVGNKSFSCFFRTFNFK